jgi:hypothetical protein
MTAAAFSGSTARPTDTIIADVVSQTAHHVLLMRRDARTNVLQSRRATAEGVR